MTAMEVLRIEAQDTYPLRHLVLRPGRPIETARFDGDTDESTFHLGAAIGGRLVGVASFYLVSNPYFSEETQFQLRGMATLSEFQGKGAGSALIASALGILTQNQCRLLWCNAREGALPFYQKIGFEIIGARFEIADVGPHFVMFKRLDF